MITTRTDFWNRAKGCRIEGNGTVSSALRGCCFERGDAVIWWRSEDEDTKMKEQSVRAVAVFTALWGQKLHTRAAPCEEKPSK
jgi:hypothetical protein